MKKMIKLDKIYAYATEQSANKDMFIAQDKLSIDGIENVYKISERRFENSEISKFCIFGIDSDKRFYYKICEDISLDNNPRHIAINMDYEAQDLQQMQNEKSVEKNLKIMKHIDELCEVNILENFNLLNDKKIENLQSSEYMLLNRMMHECKSYLDIDGIYYKDENNLYCTTPRRQINLMNELYDNLYIKPENITKEDIKALENKIIKVNIDDLDKYYEYELDDDQKMEIRIGCNKGLDIGVYAQPKFNSEKMYEIRKGLEKGLDITTYANSNFNNKQMHQIRKGLENGVDVTEYADEKFDYKQMYVIRIGLESNFDISIYKNFEFNHDQMYQIFYGIQNGVDVSAYAVTEYSWEKMSEIRQALENDYNDKSIDSIAENDWEMEI